MTADGPTAVLPPPPAPPPPPPWRPPGAGGGPVLGPRRSRAVHVFWVVVGSVLLVPTFVWLTYNGVETLAHEEQVETTTYDASAIDVLDVSTSAGRVLVVAAPTDRITVRASIGIGLRRTGRSQQVVGRTLRLRGTCPNYGGRWCRVTYEVEVPARLALRLRADRRIEVRGGSGSVDAASDSGSVTVADAAGRLTLRSSNGSVRVTGTRSSIVDARSDNGRVEVQVTRAPRSIVASSDNGSVEVVVPRTDDAYAVDVDSDTGSARNEIRSDPFSARRISVRSDNGSVTVRYG